MAFQDYSADPASNTTIGESTFIGPNMPRDNVRPALQQLSADGRALYNLLISLTGGFTGIPANVTTVVSSREAMAAIATKTAGMVVSLNEENRNGFWIWKTTAAPASDPRQGLYVPATGGHFARLWDGIHGKPEWFWLNADADWRNAFGACIALCPVMELEAKDYFVTGLWKIQTQYRTIKGGAQADGYSAGNGTRVLGLDAAQGVVQIGPDTNPGVLSAYYRNIRIENVSFGHGVGLTAPSPGSEASAVKTIRAQYVFDCRFVGVKAWEPLIGFSCYGVVRSFFDDCKVLRTAAHSGAGDFCRALWAVGAPAVAAGGNPSLFINDFSFESSSGLAITKQGIYADGEFADLFLDRVETSQCTNAIVINGSGSGTYGRLDLHIRNVVADQCSGAAIDIQGLNASSMVTISGGYVQSKATATAVVWLRGGSGSVTLGGGLQVLCAEAGTTIGIHINGQTGVTIDPTVMITDCPRPVIIDGTSPGADICPNIQNPTIGAGTQAAVAGTAVEQAIIAPTVKGGSNVFAQGVYLVGSSHNRVVVDPTKINPAAISGGATNKVRINATAITAPGYYTGAGAGGSSGAGVNVINITA